MKLSLLKFEGHVPGAYIAEKFGGKIALNGCLIITSILTLLTPVAIKIGKI